MSRKSKRLEWDEWRQITKKIYLQRFRGWPSAEMKRYYESGMSPAEAYDKAAKGRLRTDACKTALAAAKEEGRMKESEQFEMAIVPQVAEDAYQALQNELIQIQSTIESFATPAAALSALIDWHVAVATDPRVNGGMAIVPVVGKDSFVQLVPDHCDRIVWRGSYHHLPLAATKEKGE